MKKRMKMLALLLATAVTTTSVPYQNVVLAETKEVEESNDFSAYEAAIAQFALGAEEVSKDAPTPIKGVYWNNEEDQESTEYTYSDDLRTKQQNNIFKGNSVLNSSSISVSASTELSYDQATLKERLGFDSENENIDISINYGYQWHSISQDGTVQTESTSYYLYPNFNTNDVKKTYLCQVNIKSIEIEDYENGETYTYDESELNDKGIFTIVNKVFSYEYVEDESSKVLLAYKTDWLSDEEKEKLSKNNTVYIQEYEYSDSSTYKTLYAQDTSIQKNNLCRALEKSDLSYIGNIGNSEIEYAWYLEDAEGNRTKVLDEEGKEVTGDSCNANVYAKDGNAKYVCVQTLKSLTYKVYDSETASYVDHTVEFDDTTIPAGYSNTVEAVFEFKYTGLTKADFENGSAKLSDYFSGTDILQDKTVEFERFDSREYYDTESLCVEDYYASMKQTWTAYFTDGTKSVRSTSTSDYGQEYSIKTYEDIYETDESEDTTRKYVDHYVYQADLMYNGIVIDTISKNISVSYEPFTLYNEGNQTVSVRNNGKYTFTVNAEIVDTQYCQGLKYQWYSVDKEKKETILEGETDNTLKKKITDPSIKYKCKVTGVMSEDYAGPVAVKEASFSVVTSSGYRLINRTFSELSRKPGEDATFSVETSVDDGYSVNYKWERYDGTDETGKQKITEIGTESTCTVTDLKEEDFGSKYDSTTGKWWRYRVTASVCKNGETEPVETYVYYSELNNKLEYFDISCESFEKTVYKGEDAELRVTYSQNDSYTMVPQWYMEVATTKGTCPDGSTFVSLDPKFKEVEYDELSDWDTGSTDENGNVIYERIYYKKVVPDEALSLSDDKKTLTVKDAANPGRYLCYVNIYKNSEMEKAEEERVRYNCEKLEMSVNEKTDLVAYMKSGSNVEVIQGENAAFVVNGANFNTTACPITYVWEKYNNEKNAYEVIADAKTNQLNIEKVKATDFGKYRVTVKDGVEEAVFELSLTEKLKDVIVHSPSYTKFTPKVGETVTMKAESNLTEQDKVFYEWYRMETTYDDSGYWELINQDTDTYTLNVKEDKDYTTYKCIVSYKSGGTNHEQSFIYKVENSHPFSLENTTLTTQYKKLGDSATYGVRALYKDTEVSANNLTYQWYRENAEGEYEQIEGATGNTYQVSELQVKDFGSIKCLVKDTVNGNSEIMYFDTLLYTEAYLRTEDETVYGAKGSSVTLQPEIINPEAAGYTYQWYRYGEEEEHGYWDEEWDEDLEEWVDVYRTYYEYGARHILYGADSEKLDINNLMDGDFTKYECVLSYNGMKVMTYDVRLAEKTATSNIEVASQTERVTAVVKQRAELKVEAKSLDGSELKYQWYKGYADEEELLAIGNATKDTLVIEQVTPEDYGTYTCKISDKNGNSVTVRVTLSRAMNMNVSSDAYNTEDTVGYATSFGGNVTLKASASIAEGETLFYQWYKGNKKLYGENGATLTLANVTKDDLGEYRCNISNIDDDSENLYYLVYVDTGLNAVQSVSDVTEAADGSALMYVEAVANAGETITYQWSKWDDKKEKYVVIAGMNTSQYKIAQVNNKDYGEYRCVVSTIGESYTYDFELNPEYYSVVDRSYAQIGDTFTVSAKIDNPAADGNYTYQWYAEDPKTGAYMLTDCTSAVYTTKAPSVNVSSTGYKAVEYKCVIMNGSEKHTTTSEIKVLRKMDKNTTKLPETERPFSKTYDVQNYCIPNAKALDIVFEKGSDIPTIIDGNGGTVVYTSSYINGNYTCRVTGDTVIFLYRNSLSNGAGYKVSSIKAVVDVTPTVTNKPTPTGTKKATPTPTPKATKTTAPGKPTLKSVTNVKGKKMTVKISKKVKGAAGYQITYATNATFKKNKKNVNMTSTSKTIKNLKKGTTYYVKVRAYAKDSKGKKVYGAYSKVKKVKIKK